MRKSPIAPSTLPGARRAKLPDQPPKPQLATLVENAPEGDRWLHEIKFDGYRMLCRIDGDDVRFFSRSGQDWTTKLKALENPVRHFVMHQALLDGEIVVLSPDGTSSFQSLQNAFKGRREKDLVYFVFDVLYLDGYDLRHVPLERRKRLLAALLHNSAEGPIRYTDHVIGNGPEVVRQACGLGLEGVISKRRDHPYRSGRSRDWLKSKCLLTEEFIVGGYTAPAGARLHFGALLLGYFDRTGKLIYCGRVGTGFTEETLRDLSTRLQLLEIPRSPFDQLPAKEKRERGARWTKPELVVQVEFQGWTDDGHLRHPAYRGLREDKPAREVVLQARNSNS